MEIINKTNRNIKNGDVVVISVKKGEIHKDTFHKSCYLLYIPKFVKEIIIK